MTLRSSALAPWMLGAAVIAGAAVPAGRAAEAEVSSVAKGFNNTARLVAGACPRGHAGTDAEAPRAICAGLEITMPEGWKTYWRTPGEAGGVPPEFNWDASENLAAAEVLYPAPRRLTDKSGSVVGYKNSVVLPVRITPKDAAKPLALRLTATYGVCKELCVPAEAQLALDVPPAPSAVVPEIDAALALVPQKAPRDGLDPKLGSWRVDNRDSKPKLVLTVTSAAPETADAFVEAPGGLYMPLPKRTTATAATVVFEVDLTDGVDIKDLKGKTLTVTLVDGKGQSEAPLVMD